MACMSAANMSAYATPACKPARTTELSDTYRFSKVAANHQQYYPMARTLEARNAARARVAGGSAGTSGSAERAHAEQAIEAAFDILNRANLFIALDVAIGWSIVEPQTSERAIRRARKARREFWNAFACKFADGAVMPAPGSLDQFRGMLPRRVQHLNRDMTSLRTKSGRARAEQTLIRLRDALLRAVQGLLLAPPALPTMAEAGGGNMLEAVSVAAERMVRATDEIKMVTGGIRLQHEDVLARADVLARVYLNEKAAGRSTTAAIQHHLSEAAYAAQALQLWRAKGSGPTSVSSSKWPAGPRSLVLSLDPRFRRGAGGSSIKLAF